MKAGDRVVLNIGYCIYPGVLQRDIEGHPDETAAINGDDGFMWNMPAARLSLIDDKPTQYPWLKEGEIQDWFKGIRELTNEEIDKLGRGLSDD